jgi:hypothetical protein
VQVVLTSGYSHVLATDAHHGFPLLHKPYSVEELSHILRQASVDQRVGVGGQAAAWPSTDLSSRTSAQRADPGPPKARRSGVGPGSSLRYARDDKGE